MRDFHATPELCPPSAASASASVARSRLLAAGKPPGVAIMARPVVAAPPVKRAASAADQSGAASGAQGCSAPPSAPPSPESDDAALLARFQTWIEHQARVLVFPGDAEREAEFNALDSENTDLMLHAAEMPAHTLTGLAIKAFLLLHISHGGGKEPVSLDDVDFRGEVLFADTKLAARLRDDVLRVLSDAGIK
jgi:hypothetical protein